MTKITLVQEAYACGGSVRAGHDSIRELTDWYEAVAEDDNGNDYRVIWAISNPDAEDEGDICDWSAPWAIIDEDYNDVSDTVTLDGDE